MPHGPNPVSKREIDAVQCKSEGKSGVGSRRIFAPQFKLQVLDSYRNDADCKGNQRATARKYGIHRRQIQKWLQVESTLRNGLNGKSTTQTVHKSEMSLNVHRQRDDETSAKRSASLAAEARVPALEPPAGWWTQQQAPIYVPDPSTPMDLSIKRELLYSTIKRESLPSPPDTVFVPVPGPSPSLPSPEADVWDLSSKNENKRKTDPNEEPPSKPKLFKPYLDDWKEDHQVKQSIPIVVVAPQSSQVMYCCQTPCTQCCTELYYSNNNYCCDQVKSHTEFHFSYTFHELPSRTSYCPFGYCPDQSDPLYPRPSEQPPRNASPIDTALCKGNPRAVALKYRILRSVGQPNKLES